MRKAAMLAGIAVLVLALLAMAQRAADGTPAATVPPFEILGHTVLPGQRRDLNWRAGDSFTGTPLETPVLVVQGTRPGSTLMSDRGDPW